MLRTAVVVIMTAPGGNYDGTFFVFYEEASTTPKYNLLAHVARDVSRGL